MTFPCESTRPRRIRSPSRRWAYLSTRISTGIYRFITNLLYGGIIGNTEGLRKSVIQDGSWDERRIELEIVFLFGSEVQCVNVIFDLMILLRFLTSLDGVRLYSTTVVRFALG